MAALITSALCRRFVWTSGGAGADSSVKIGGTPYPVTIASGTYAILAGPSSGTAPDFLRVFAAAVNTAIVATGKTCVVGMTAAGLVTFALNDGSTFNLNNSSALDALLGNLSATSVTSTTAQTQPQQIFLARVRTGSRWKVIQPGAYGVTAAGVPYGVRSNTVSAVCEPTFGSIPLNPTVQAALGVPQTVLEPAAAGLAALGSQTGQWSLADLLVLAGGSTFTWLDGNFQAARTDTSQQFYVVAIDPQDLAEPRIVLEYEPWVAYSRWTVRLQRNATTPIVART